MSIRKVKLPDGTYVDVHDNRIVLTSPSEGQLMKYDSETGNIVNEDAGFIPDPGPVPVNDGDIIEWIVQDYDGNWYNGVVLNNQIWLKENLRVTHNPNGDAITYRHANNDSSNDETYGLLYTWNTIMNGAVSSNTVPSGVQGIAPNGWHIPSDAEWTQFTTYIGSQPQYRCDNNNEFIAKALASTIGWNSSSVICAVGNNPSTNNITGFSALPAGGYFYVYDRFGIYAVFSSATESDDDDAYSFALISSSPYVNKYGFHKYFGISVRCICDMSASDWFAQNINRFYLKYTTNGVIWSQLSSVAESGSYNDLLDKPTIPAAQVQSDWNQTDSSAVDYIKNKPTIPTVRTMNGEQLTDSSLGDINIHDGFYFPNAVQDYDGNWYGAVVIGNQVWLGENLRTTHYNDGTEIENGGDTPSYDAKYYEITDSPFSFKETGYMYSNAAINKGEESSSIEGFEKKGLAPIGWRVTNGFDWQALNSYLSRNVRYSTKKSKSLASTRGWNSSNSDNATGNQQELNNTTGLNIFPIESTIYTTVSQTTKVRFNYGGESNTFRSNDVVGGSSAVFVSSLHYNYNYISQGNLGSYTDKPLSVRCISNLTPIQFRDWYIKQYGSLQHILPAAQIQSDWNQTDSNAPDFIKNKPDISTVAFRFW